MRRMLLSFVAAVAAIPVLAVPAAAGEKYVNREHGFTLELPNGWAPVPAAHVKTMSSELRRRSGLKTGYLAMFTSRTAVRPYPNVALQVLPYPKSNVSFAEIEYELGRVLDKARDEAKRAVQDVAKNLIITKPIFDREKYRLSMRAESDIPPYGRVVGTCMWICGKKEMIGVYCYCEDANLPEYTRTFSRVIDSFKFDEETAYDPATAGTFRGGWLKGGMRGAIYGGGIGLAIAGVMYLLKALNRPSSHRTSYQPPHPSEQPYQSGRPYQW